MTLCLFFASSTDVEKRLWPDIGLTCICHLFPPLFYTGREIWNLCVLLRVLVLENLPLQSVRHGDASKGAKILGNKMKEGKR
jgi:hypothetical protein